MSVCLGVRLCRAATPVALPQPGYPTCNARSKNLRPRSRSLGLRDGQSRLRRVKSRAIGRASMAEFSRISATTSSMRRHTRLRQRGSDKNLLRRNQFGFNLAGPLTIPKLYNTAARRSFRSPTKASANASRDRFFVPFRSSRTLGRLQRNRRFGRATASYLRSASTRAESRLRRIAAGYD